MSKECLMETIFSALFNILYIYTSFRFIRLFITKKNENLVLQSIIYVLVWTANCIIFFTLENRYLTTSSMFILLMVATIILYEGSIIRKFTAVISALALGILFEEMVWRVILWSGESSPNKAAGSLLSAFSYVVFILVIERFFNVNKTEYISKSSYFNIILILTGSIVLVEVLANVEEEYEWILVGLSAICLINVSTFFLYDKVNEVFREKVESQVMEEKVLMHENQLELMKQSQENIGSLWHDMKNHLLLLDTYLKDKDYEGASKYIANIEDYMHVPGQYVNSGNHEVDAILNYRLGKAEKMGCRIVTKLKIPDCSFMPAFDLNMILGNLLDNALEALEHVDDKYLSVELTYKKGILLIHINNTFDGTIRHSGGEFLTRKKDRENHGMGLRNVEYIVKKYNGEQNIQTSESMFRISIILYVKNL